MAIANRIFAGTRNRLMREAQAWIPPKGEHAKRVNLLESCYLLGVFMLMMLGMSIAKGMGIALILVMGLSVFAMSKGIRDVAKHQIYQAVASKLGWPTWEEGIRQDEAALAKKEAPAAQVSGTEATDPSPSTQALTLWADLEPSLRKERAVPMVAFLLKCADFPELGLLKAMGKDQDLEAAEVTLATIARRNGLNLATAQEVPA